MKIRTRLILSFTLLIGVGFYFLTGWVLDDLRPRYLESVEDVLVDTSNILSSFLEKDLQEQKIDVAEFRQIFNLVRQKNFEAKIYELKKTSVDLQVLITDFQGKVIFDSNNGKQEGQDYSEWRDFILTKRGQYGSRSSKNPEDLSSSILHVAAPIKQNGNLVGVLILAKPTGNIRFFMNMAKPKIQLVGGAVAVSLIFLAGLLSLWITRPIEKLITHIREIQAGKRSPKPKLGRNEISEMADALEDMRLALEGKDYIENYVQTLTHEIKSPLTAIRGAAELLKENLPPEQKNKFLDNILQENERIQNFVERMLLLSALEKRSELQETQNINIKDIFSEILERLQFSLLEKKIVLEIENEKELFLKGEKFLLEQALLNLLQNAIDFSPQFGKIIIHALQNKNRIEINISDEGPGIPDYAQDKVFEKFFSLPRPSSGKKSTGLGLSFVKEVIHLHGGKIQFLSNNPGCQVIIKI